jgi:hypothetical protein
MRRLVVPVPVPGGVSRLCVFSGLRPGGVTGRVARVAPGSAGKQLVRVELVVPVERIRRGG